MSRVIITTVGTSLKTNSERAKTPIDELLRADPRKASAELNVLDRLLQDGDRVELLHTDTEDGRLCAEALEGWLRARRVPVERMPIIGFTDANESLDRGLRALVCALGQRVRTARRQRETPLLNALGGYKPVVVYATLVGTLLKIGNYYISEGAEALREIPPLPMAWDYAEIDPYAASLRWLDEEPRSAQEAHSRLARIPAPLRDVLIDDDGIHAFLSALGEAYFAAYQIEVENADEPLLLSQAAQTAYAAMESSTQAAFDRVLQRLRVPGIRRNGSETVDRDHGDVCVFPRGHVDERVFWREEEGTVRVLEMARHGRDYEALYNRGVRRAEYSNDDWTPWQG